MNGAWLGQLATILTILGVAGKLTLEIVRLIRGTVQFFLRQEQHMQYIETRIDETIDLLKEALALANGRH